MKKHHRFLCLLIFIWAGIFVADNINAAPNYTAELPTDCLTDGSDFTSNEVFWFDGDRFRISFDVEKTFCVGWSRALTNNYFLKTNYYPLNIYIMAGESDYMSAFVADPHDLDLFNPGETRYFKFEQGQRYEAYLADKDSVSWVGFNNTRFLLESLWAGGWRAAEFQKVKINLYVNPKNIRRFNFNFIYHAPEKELEPVILIPGILGSFPVSDQWEVDPIFNTYDNLWQALESAGYQAGINLFALPYDWHQTNFYSAKLLKEKINEVKAICQCDKVDVIGHSMGGLVARAYVEGDEYQNDVDQLIFLGTPHRGATKAYLMWEGGEVGVEAVDNIYEKIFALEADASSFDNVVDFLHQLPVGSVQQLLPVYNYIKKLEDGKWRIVSYGDAYPRNKFLEWLNSYQRQLRMNLVNCVNIVANDNTTSTLTYLKLEEHNSVAGEWQHGQPQNYYSLFGDHGLEYGWGDGTVPLYGRSYFKKEYVVTSTHNKMVTETQKIVVRELTGKEPVSEIRSDMINRYLMVRIFSPANFQIIDPQGRRLGSFEGSDINEIDGSFYTGSNGKIEFALIPEPLSGFYQINLSGTDTGEYKLSISTLKDREVDEKEIVGQTSAGQKQSYLIKLEDQSTLSPIIPGGQSPAGLTEVIKYFREQGDIIDDNSANHLIQIMDLWQKKDYTYSNILNLWQKKFEKENEKNQISQFAYDVIKLIAENINKNYEQSH